MQLRNRGRVRANRRSSGRLLPIVRVFATLTSVILLAGATVAWAQAPAGRSEQTPGVGDASATHEPDLGDAPRVRQPKPRPLEWSETPGVYEIDLARRNRNPFYVPARRRIGREELRAAKRRDAELQWEALEIYIDLANAKKRMARLDSAEEITRALTRIDAATILAMEVGGEAYELAGALGEIRSWLLREWSEGRASSNPDVLDILEVEARYPVLDSGSAALRMVAQLEMVDGPIQDFERAAALMSEDDDTIVAAVATLGRSQRQQIAAGASDLLDDLERSGGDGKTIKRARGKLAAVQRGARGDGRGSGGSTWRHRSNARGALAADPS